MIDLNRLTLSHAACRLRAGPLERSVRRGVTNDSTPDVEAGATEHAGAIEKTACSASWHLAPRCSAGRRG